MKARSRFTFGIWLLASGFFTAALGLGPVASASAQMIMRDTAPRIVPMGVGTSSISGTVVSDEGTPQGIARARVDLTIEGQAPKTVYTDNAGAFVFSAIPAGRYSLTATKPAFVRANFGAKRPNRPGTPVTVTDGQRAAGLQIRMARGAVITGTIRDEMGQPAPGVTVRVLQYRMQNGERTLAPVPLASSAVGETTDDRGVYRLYGLPAGEYILTASPRALGPGDVRQITAAELQSVQRASVPRPATTPPPPPPPPQTVTYATVFYPGTNAAASAAPITVTAGEERSGVDLQLQLARTSRIEGTISAPPGVSPASVDLMIVPAGPTAPGPALGGLGMMTFNRVRADSEGRFAYPGMAPGRYTVTARAAGGFWASADVTVEGQDISGVRLDMAPGLTIAGRVEADPTRGAAPDLTAARVMLTPAGGQMMVVSIGSNAPENADGRVGEDGRFTLSNVVPGKYRLNANMPGAGGGWVLKSATAGGKNILDFPIEIGPSDRVSDALLTFTNQIQDISGAVQDQAGRPAPDYTIVVFPGDRNLWPAARRIATSRPGTDGKFQIRGMPAGEYRIAALVDIAPGEANDPALLEQLVPASVAFTLAEGERKIQDVKIAGG